ncbi:hypothetical protein NBRC116592_09400 [Colwellia sp. KU-HH00111]|uniref:CheR family methyltransferase n=1 Tax=Colwellia sp. KU-HH00111 TaxID=3127652 RepID=UPI0031020B42
MNDTPPMDRQSDTNTTHIVVGIGASAGGLEALQLLVSHLPKNSGLSYVLAQHLSPSHKSMMVDLLKKSATIPIVKPVNGEIILPDTFYICPPNQNIEINQNNQIILSDVGEVRHIPRPSVDMLFESIAFVKGDNAIGIVLSGTGSDGSRGVGLIKGEGGISIAQDPNTAKFDGMPESAINSGNIDLILPPEEIGNELVNIIKFPREPDLNVEENVPREVYTNILRKIKRQSKVDFTLYKESTIMRRIKRRMMALKISSVIDYLQYLNDESSEIEILFNDMLIGVTSFIRNPRAFDKLSEELEHYLENKDNSILRVWVAGCSTGEEAYSIAITLHELLGKKIKDYKVQIFATDIDSKAIDYARNGVYPESAISNISKAMRRKYFTVNGELFEISKAIKANVIFSVHDLTRDPPFLRLDLITCRNLLIYFNLELQRQIMPLFHYALNPKGLLFLGQSESIGVFQEHFRTMSKNGKVYEAVFIGKKVPPDRNNHRFEIKDYVEAKIKETAKPSTKTKSASVLTDLIALKLKEAFLPNAILVNENMDIVFSSGNNPLLVRPEGLPTNNIYQNLHPALSIDLRSGAHLIDSGQSVVYTAFQRVFLKEEQHWARLILVDIPYQAGMGRLILIFTQIEESLNLPIASMDGDSDLSLSTFAKEQERQLLKAKEQLQTVIEELETSNEEMQSMNEELQSSNEELQSSNEELETTNEELQSTNEELQTAYAELRMAYDEKELQQQKLNAISEELELTNTLLEDAERMGKTGSLLWDLEHHTMQWSKGTFKVFDLDEGVFVPSYEAFIGLAHTDDRAKLEQHLTNLVTSKINEIFVYRALTKHKETLWVSLDSVVSFGPHKQAEKVLGTITNITVRVNAENKLAQQQKNMDVLMNKTLNGFYIYDFVNNKNIHINQAYTNILGYTKQDIDKMNAEEFSQLFHPDDLDNVINHMTKLSNVTQSDEAIAIKYRFKHKTTGNYLTLYSNDMVYEFDENGKPLSMLGTFFEI